MGSSRSTTDESSSGLVQGVGGQWPRCSQGVRCYESEGGISKRINHIPFDVGEDETVNDPGSIVVGEAVSAIYSPEL